MSFLKSVLKSIVELERLRPVYYLFKVLAWTVTYFSSLINALNEEFLNRNKEHQNTLCIPL